MLNKRQQRNTLIYLYIHFKQNQSLILKELLEQNLVRDGLTPTEVDKFLEDNLIDTDDYITFVDKGYPVDSFDPEHPVFVIKKVRIN